jgi:L-iditol 2-dehydrogenase
VQVIAAVPDGTCVECRTTSMTVCSNQRSIGYHWDGGFAEWMAVPEQVLRVDGLSIIPKGTSYAEAAVSEPLACALNGQELAGVGKGDTVVVTGAGPIGCLHVRLARARGAGRVFLIDINAERLTQSAERVHPDATIDSSAVDPVDEVHKLTDGRGADVIITAAASGKAQMEALEMAAPRARISLFGGLPKDDPFIQLNSNTVHYRELTVVGASGSTPAHNRTALNLIASGEVPVDDLITDRLPLEQVTEAIQRVMSGSSIKVVIEP